MTTIVEKATEPVLVDPIVLAEMMQKYSQNQNNQNNQSIEKERPLTPWTSAARGLFSGADLALTNVEAYAEYIMNWYDISLRELDNGQTGEINGYLYSTTENKKVSSIIIEDDGPGFPTDSEKPFMEEFLQFHAENKNADQLKYIGTAGIGAKNATGKLGAHWVFTWSDGNGKKATAIFNRETFINPDDYQFRIDDYEGASFFKIEISKLYKADQVAPSEYRDALSKKFTSKIEAHPAVKIYLTGPTFTGKKHLKPKDGVQFVDNLKEEFSVDYNGATAKVIIGLSDFNKTDGGSWVMPMVRLSRLGVAHFEKTSCPAHELIFADKSGKEIKYHWKHRNTFVSIDSDAFKPSQMKNDFLWDDDRTIDILKMIGQDSRFVKMLDKIVAYNETHDNKSNSKELTASEDQHLKKMAAQAAAKFGEIVIDKGYKGYYTTSDDIQEIIKKRKNLNVAKRKNGSNTGRQSNSSNNISNSSDVKGSKYTFTISYVPLGENITRYHIEIDNGVISLIVNEDYAGRDKIRLKNTYWPEFLYIADTIGISLQDFLLREKLTANDPINEPDWNYLCSVRDEIVSNCLNIEFKS